MLPIKLCVINIGKKDKKMSKKIIEFIKQNFIDSWKDGEEE